MKIQNSKFKVRGLRFGVGLIILLFVALFCAVYFGSEKLSFFEMTGEQKTILFDIRLPRVLLGATVGASLAIAGAALQSLLEKSACRTVFARRFKRRGSRNNARVRVLFAVRFCASCDGINRRGRGDICRLSNGEITRRNECRKTRFIGRDRDDFSVVNHHFADFAFGRGKAQKFYILAARRSVAGDEKRILFDFSCRHFRNDNFDIAGKSLESDDDRRTRCF